MDDEKLDELGQKLGKIRSEEQAELDSHAQKEIESESMSIGIRAGAELVGAIVAGAILGMLMDGWFNSKPFMLIVMLMLGVVTGFINVYRVSQNIGTAPGYSQLHKQKKQAKTRREN